MKTEVKHEGTIHSADLSMWDKRAECLCGKTFKAGTFKETILYGGVDCPECKKVRKTGKTPCRGRCGCQGC